MLLAVPVQLPIKQIWPGLVVEYNTVEPYIGVRNAAADNSAAIAKLVFKISSSAAWRGTYTSNCKLIIADKTARLYCPGTAKPLKKYYLPRTWYQGQT